MFIKFLLFINNSLVSLLVTNANSSIEGLLGESMITSIETRKCNNNSHCNSYVYLFVYKIKYSVYC